MNNNVASVENISYSESHAGREIVKRGLDIVFSLIALVLFSWLFLIIYIAILLQNDGKIFFKQERIGKGGKPFTIYKFRTMKENDNEVVPMLEQEEDPRLTKTGNFLRRHHLDELPQLVNVLKGDMSFVGPRPETQYFIDKIMEHDNRYPLLYELRPGVTSEATLHNGYTDTMEKMLKRLDRDLYYLENRSTLMDLRLIAETATSIIFGKKF